jgi:hypothetical protein
MLRGLTNASAYVDDVKVYSKTFNEHLIHLEEVFIRIREFGLKVKTSKCSFCMEETKFLGFVVSKDGIKPDPKKVEAARNYPKPMTKKQMKQFLGFASFDRRFVKSFAMLADTLNEMTRKDVKFEWKEEREAAFEKLKKELADATLLAYPDFCRRFKVTTDASAIGIGAVLSQADDSGNDRVICYSSRPLSKTERRYSTIEREMLAMIWATKHYRVYLTSVEFDILTDHKPLVHLRNLKECSPRMIKWRGKLEEFNFRIIYIKGSENTCADTLSRLGELSCNNINIIKSPIDLEQMKESQSNDPFIKSVLAGLASEEQKYANFGFDNGLLYWTSPNKRNYEDKCTPKLVVPNEMRETVLTALHDDMSGGHLGENKTLEKVKSKFFWKRLANDVLSWCQACKKCAARKRPPPRRAELFPILKAVYPFQLIGVDFLGPFPETEDGNQYVIVFTDYSSRWAEAFATKDMTAETVAWILITEIICRHGAPEVLLSDQGKNFLSDLVKEVCRLFKINKINTTAYHPQTNGLTEKFNALLCQILSVYINENQSNWDKFIPICLLAYRTSFQRSVGESPFRLLYGRDATH